MNGCGKFILWPLRTLHLVEGFFQQMFEVQLIACCDNVSH